ncbi:MULTISPECIES: TraK domain-containing protein [Vibrio]|uniref:TraK domain-containing protein n=1 Tax=Vibrio TaxID=662 RepID=UPI0001B93F9C|nr:MULTISPECIES: type-F conjugative transfer system secretin TraK [Vibrio]EEX34492.1 IncF plasmid conjugative transfer pilus assembly protein TraK [Vibrio coralliilyticus ATCC BAA-450]MDE3898529.1 type-F conjugative transfer system secretin TraK [Vibrio sp. CC007]
MIPHAISFVLLSMSLNTALASSASPAQPHLFVSGDTVTLELNQRSLNRLYVDNDKILNLTCPTHQCEVVQNPSDQAGSILLGLSEPHPFTAHLFTEQGRLLALEVQPSDTTTRVHRFIPGDASHPQTLNTRILGFVKDLMHWSSGEEPSVSMTIARVTHASVMAHRGDLELTPVAVARQGPLSGIIYEVLNTSEGPTSISNRDFYSPSALAASLDRNELPAGERTRLYLITLRAKSHD